MRAQPPGTEQGHRQYQDTKIPSNATPDESENESKRVSSKLFGSIELFKINSELRLGKCRQCLADPVLVLKHTGCQLPSKGFSCRKVLTESCGQLRVVRPDFAHDEFDGWKSVASSFSRRTRCARNRSLASHARREMRSFTLAGLCA